MTDNAESNEERRRRAGPRLAARALLALLACAIAAPVCAECEWQETGLGPVAGMPSFHANDRQYWRHGGLCMEFTGRFDMFKRVRAPCWTLPDWTSWYMTSHGYGGKAQVECLNFGSLRPEWPGGVERAPGMEGDWTCRIAAFRRADSGASVGRLFITRAMPGVIMETETGGANLFAAGDAGLPQYFVIQTVDGPELFDLKTLGQLSDKTRSAKGVASVSWMLAWWGRKSLLRAARTPLCKYNSAGDIAADCPFLFVFGDTGLSAVSAPAEPKPMLKLSFDGKKAAFVMLPLLGDYYPAAEETQAWSGEKGLPEKILAQCEWWAQHLGRAPYSAREHYSYDRDRDTVRVETVFRYVDLRKDADFFAPLPPMLVLASGSALPLRLSAEPVMTSALTYVGPYCAVPGADRWSYEVSGLAKYVFASRSGAAPESGPALELLKELELEVEKVLDAGSLAPWHVVMSGFKGPAYAVPVFTKPGEVHYYLGEALPLLSQSLRERVLAYMREEAEARPIINPEFLRAAEGARRERYARNLKPEILETFDKNMLDENVFVHNGMAPETAVYFLERYITHCGGDAKEAFQDAEEVLAQFLPYNDWPSMGWSQIPMPRGLSGHGEFEGMGGAPDANRYFAALAAAIRLARAAGAPNEDMYWGLLARTAALRCGMAQYMRRLYADGILELPKDPAWMPKLSHPDPSGAHLLYTFDFKGPEDDLRQITHMNQFGVDARDYYNGTVHFHGLTPEFGLFAREFLREDMTRYAARVAENMPDWYRVRSQGMLYDEVPINMPHESYYGFLVRAYAGLNTAEELEHFLDIPWLERGDWYYIHKLAETIKAYQGWEWKWGGEKGE